MNETKQTSNNIQFAFLRTGGVSRKARRRTLCRGEADARVVLDRASARDLRCPVAHRDDRAVQRICCDARNHGGLCRNREYDSFDEYDMTKLVENKFQIEREFEPQFHK